MTECSLLHLLLLNTLFNHAEPKDVAKQRFCKIPLRKLRLREVAEIGEYRIEIGRVRYGHTHSEGQHSSLRLRGSKLQKQQQKDAECYT